MPEPHGEKDDAAPKRSTTRYGCREAASLGRFPLIPAAYRTHDVAENLHRSSHGSKLPPGGFGGGRRHDICDGFTEASHANRPAGFTDFFEDAQALCLEFG